jgi:hypothetical protein
VARAEVRVVAGLREASPAALETWQTPSLADQEVAQAAEARAEAAREVVRAEVRAAVVRVAARAVAVRVAAAREAAMVEVEAVAWEVAGCRGPSLPPRESCGQMGWACYQCTQQRRWRRRNRVRAGRTTAHLLPLVRLSALVGLSDLARRYQLQ